METLQAALVILARWLHLASAGLLLGGAFFFRFLLPVGTRNLDPQRREEVTLRCRRAFKGVVHATVLTLLASGAYNAVRNWPDYGLNHWLLHPLWGLHLFAALGAMAILLVQLAGREPGRRHRGWLRAAVLLMFLAIAAASTLKWAREWVVSHPEAQEDFHRGE